MRLQYLQQRSVQWPQAVFSLCERNIHRLHRHWNHRPTLRSASDHRSRRLDPSRWHLRRRRAVCGRSTVLGKHRFQHQKLRQLQRCLHERQPMRIQYLRRWSLQRLPAIFRLPSKLGYCLPNNLVYRHWQQQRPNGLIRRR